MNAKVFFAILGCIFLWAGCTEEILTPDEVSSVPASTPMTKAEPIEWFDWEHVDWMPTPPGQARIPIPWNGQGSLVGSYELDVVNDYKSIDGWRLLYSTFTTQSDIELENPYFMLYNIYRGVLRLYFYITDDIVTISDDIVSTISLETTSGKTSNILNYLAPNESDNILQYTQIQPARKDGGAPVGSNRWYMVEYELAYDPNLSNINCSDIRLNFLFDYRYITSIQLSGSMQQEFTGTIGTGSPEINQVFTEGEELITSSGAGMIAFAGALGLEKAKEKNIGIPSVLFESLLSGVKSALSSFVSGVPSSAVGIINGIFGKTSGGSEPIPISIRSEAEFSLQGTNAGTGAFPSTSISIYIPGTDLQGAQGYIPYTNEPLGVFCWTGSHIPITIYETIEIHQVEDDIMFSGTYEERYTQVFLKQREFLNEIEINPYLEKYAEVTIEACDIFAMNTTTGNIYTFPMKGVERTNPYETSDPVPEFDKVYFRVVIKVDPKDGSGETFIYKTFDAKYYTDISTRYY